MKSILVIAVLIFSLAQYAYQSEGNANSNQTAATNNSADGRTITWEEQGVSFTVPAGWREEKTEIEDNFKLQGPDGAGLSIDVLSLKAETSPERELAEHDGLLRLQAGKFDELRYLELDGVRGLFTRAAPGAVVDDAVTLNWVAYRRHKGKQQFISLHLSSPRNSFSKRRDEIYAVLASTKLAQS
jgi:hypothetical protein